MPAAGKYFPPGVEGGRAAVEHDEELLGEAEPADARGGVVGPCPGQDGPDDAVGDVLVGELPDVGAEQAGIKKMSSSDRGFSDNFVLKTRISIFCD